LFIVFSVCALLSTDWLSGSGQARYVGSKEERRREREREREEVERKRIEE